MVVACSIKVVVSEGSTLVTRQAYVRKVRMKKGQ